MTNHNPRHPRRPARESIWLDDAMLDDPALDDDEEDERDKERDPDLTESALIAQLGLKDLPDDSYS